jgi:hypothetical protein
MSAAYVHSFIREDYLVRMEELLVAALHDEEMIIMELWVALDVLVSIPTAQIASTEVTLPTDDNGNIPILKRKKVYSLGLR